MQFNNVSQLLIDQLDSVGLTVTQHQWEYKVIGLFLLAAMAWIFFKFTRIVLRGKLTKLVLNTKNTWDDELHNHHFFRRCGHIVPALAIYVCSPVLFAENDPLITVLQKSMVIYLIGASVFAASALFNTIEDVYNASELAKRAPITGFIQVAKLIIVIAAALLVIASLLNKSPIILLSGLGAVTAILLLLFRDAILGFVAGIQIAANRMVNTGDWIEMPKFGADGNVLEVGLTTVKVQNWDNTISTIPTYALITDPVKNWRGMSESAGRRIKRSIYIDIHSIKFCDMDMLERFHKIRYISEYIDKKKQQLAEFHKNQNIDEQDLVNSRRLTNIGTLRAYMQSYLVNHPALNKELTLMVRQLPPTELGLPIEIYCFSAEKNWIKYEGIQADIMDHLLAILPVFELSAYQRISDKQK